MRRRNGTGGVALKIVKPQPNQEVIERLQLLLDEARVGALAGFFYGAIYTGGEYAVDVVGEANERPIITRGLLQYLNDEIGRKLGLK